jgi:hypothetical protein
MPATYEPIATVTVGTAGTSFIVMDNIPQTYTDLVLIINGSSASATQIGLRINNVSSLLYSHTVIGGNGTSASSARSTRSEGGNTSIVLDYFNSLTTTGGAGIVIANVMNYTNTTTDKTVLMRANNAGTGLSASVGLFGSTNAVTRLDVVSRTANNISIGSTFTLYGIKAA